MERVAVVKKPTLYETSNDVVLSSKIIWDRNERELWFQFAKKYSSNIDIEIQDWALLALIIPAMREGVALEFECSLSPLILHNALNDLQCIFTSQIRDLNKIKIKSKNTKIAGKNSKRNIGIGFSAGIDSLSSLALLSNSDGVKPTHLATLNVGAMGKRLESKEMLSKYSNRVNRICESGEYNALVIDSNISDFYDDFTFQSTHTIRTAAAILSLGNTFSCYFYSSGFTYSEISVANTIDMAKADPILLPLFSNEITQFCAIGTQFSRLDKVSLVLDYPLSYDYLDVCVAPIEQRLSTLNCGVCIKCIRQLITLDILESLDKYCKVFNINDYKLNRKKLFYILAMNALNPERLNNSDFDVFVLAFDKFSMNFVNFNLVIKSSKFSWKIRNFWAKILSQKFSSYP